LNLKFEEFYLIFINLYYNKLIVFHNYIQINYILWEQALIITGGKDCILLLI